MTNLSGHGEIHRLAVVGARVLDGTGRGLLEPTTISIEGDRIVGLGPSPTTPVAAGARQIDGRGKFVIPGLVDMHVHVYTPDKWHPEFFLAAAVTTVMDLRRQPSSIAPVSPAAVSRARTRPSNIS